MGARHDQQEAFRLAPIDLTLLLSALLLCLLDPLLCTKALNDAALATPLADST